MLKPLNANPIIASDDILVVGCVRNECLRLPRFLEHHRDLGVNKFLLVDNASSDGTQEYLLRQQDVALFETSQRYSESNCGVDWLNTLLDTFAVGHWTLVLDADELFVFPGFETTSLAHFVNHLSKNKFEAIAAPMLDMYSGTALAETDYRAGDSLLDACPFFDGDGFEFKITGKSGPEVIHRGGPRHRLFWRGFDRSYPSPVLTKFPLMKWRKEFKLEASTHILRKAQIANVSGVLLHFKFLQDFVTNAHEEAERQEHFAGARQYSVYAEVLLANPDLCAMYEKSIRYKNSHQLVDHGLMTIPKHYPFFEVQKP